MSIEQDEHTLDCLQNSYAEYLDDNDLNELDGLFEHFAFLLEKKPVPDLRAWVISYILTRDPTGKQDDCFQDTYTHED